ncbi:MAG: type II toxin-antitoxin system PemK/MazF family toxin [Caldilineaceae bacterium]
MAFQRGDVVLIPFPFTDLTATKTRPAVVVNGSAYQRVRSELLLVYVSSQISKAAAPIDYVLIEWQAAGLLKPSFVRPKIAAIEPALIVHHVGRLSVQDMYEVDRRLRSAMELTTSVLPEVAQELDFAQQSPAVVQLLAEKTVAAVVAFSKAGNQSVDLDRIRELL